MNTLRRKQFHSICVAVIVGFFAVKAIIAVRDSIYILAYEQLIGIVIVSFLLIGWIYEKVKSKACAEDVSEMMTAWYLGFALAVVLSNGLASIKEQNRRGREMRAKMTDGEWQEFNEQIKEDVRQDYFENRRP